MARQLSRVRLSVSIPAEMDAALRQLAESQWRTVSSLIEESVGDYLAARSGPTQEPVRAVRTHEADALPGQRSRRA
jgi:predicted transcriptional regulator